MGKVETVKINPLNNPLNPQQQAVYGSFLTGGNLDKLGRLSFIEEGKIDEYESAQDAKRKKIAKYSIMGAVAITLAGLILSPKFLPRSVKDRISGFVNNKFKQLIENASASNNPQLRARYERYQANIKGSVENLNVLNNFSTVKDAFLRQKVYKYCPPLRWLDRKSAELYYKTSSTMCKKAFEKMFKAFGASDAEIKAALRGINSGKLKDTVTIGGQKSEVGALIEEVQDLLAKRRGILEKSYGQPAQEASRKKIVETLGDLDGPFWEKLTTMLKGKQSGECKKLLNTYVLQDMIAADKAKLAQEFGADALKITGEGGINRRIQEILDAILDKNVLQNEISPFAQKANSSLNKALDMHSNVFVDKMRDVCVGTAATDVLSILGSAGALGLYTAQAKTKEERTSVALTTGVPLGLGIIGTTIATIKMVNGFKALAVGFATTMVSGIIGKSLDKAYKKKHGIEDGKPSIPTIKIPLTDAIESTGITGYVDAVTGKIVK